MVEILDMLEKIRGCARAVIGMRKARTVLFALGCLFLLATPLAVESRLVTTAWVVVVPAAFSIAAAVAAIGVFLKQQEEAKLTAATKDAVSDFLHLQPDTNNGAAVRKGA